MEFRDTYWDENFIYHSKLLEVILMTTLDNGKDIYERSEFLWKTDISYNILMNKLKKYFSFINIIRLLCNEDNLLNMN